MLIQIIFQVFSVILHVNNYFPGNLECQLAHADTNTNFAGRKSECLHTRTGCVIFFLLYLHPMAKSAPYGG